MILTRKVRNIIIVQQEVTRQVVRFTRAVTCYVLIVTKLRIVHLTKNCFPTNRLAFNETSKENIASNGDKDHDENVDDCKQF